MADPFTSSVNQALGLGMQLSSLRQRRLEHQNSLIERRIDRQLRREQLALSKAAGVRAQENLELSRKFHTLQLREFEERLRRTKLTEEQRAIAMARETEQHERQLVAEAQDADGRDFFSVLLKEVDSLEDPDAQIGRWAAWEGAANTPERLVAWNSVGQMIDSKLKRKAATIAGQKEMLQRQHQLLLQENELKLLRHQLSVFQAEPQTGVSTTPSGATGFQTPPMSTLDQQLSAPIVPRGTPAAPAAPQPPGLLSRAGRFLRSTPLGQTLSIPAGGTIDFSGPIDSDLVKELQEGEGF